MENPIAIHDLGGPPLFLEIPISMATGGGDCIIPLWGNPTEKKEWNIPLAKRNL